MLIDPMQRPPTAIREPIHFLYTVNNINQTMEHETTTAQAQSQDRRMENSQRVLIPIPVLYESNHIANITGVGTSGREYIQCVDTNNVILGFDQLIHTLVAARGRITRHTVQTVTDRLCLSLRGNQIRVNTWKNKLLGWGYTTNGTVACICNSLSLGHVTAGVGTVAGGTPPTQIIHLPETPMDLPSFTDGGLSIVAEIDEWSDVDTVEMYAPLEEMVYEDGEYDSGIDYPEEEEEEELGGTDHVRPVMIQELVNIINGQLEGDGEQARQGTTVVRDIQHLLRRSSQQGQQCTICCDDFTDADKHVAPPCGDPTHRVCHSCLARYATNWTCHCVSANQPYVSCPHEGCDAMYDPAVVDGLISEADQRRLKERIARFERLQTVHYQCPKCHERVATPSNVVRDRCPGTTAVRCSKCQQESCYHCLADLPPGSVAQMQNATIPLHLCGVCITPHAPLPGEFNRYVGKQTLNSPIPRNYELTKADVVRELVHIVEDPALATKCRGCDAAMCRTTQCMELTHCGVRRCTCCGMSGLMFENHLIDHWGRDGRFGTCPRWMSDSYWHMVTHARTRCVEGACHSDTHDCTAKEHEPYREQVLGARRLRHFHRVLGSLPVPLQKQVFASIVERGEGKLSEMLNRLQVARTHGGIV